MEAEAENKTRRMLNSTRQIRFVLGWRLAKYVFELPAKTFI
jgi:hypothetical protein